MCFSLACVLPLDALLLDLLRNYVFFLPDLKKTKQRTIKKTKLVYCATMWTCLALHWGFYDSTNEWPGYECVVPLCPSELCTDEQIPESNGNE